MHDYRNIALFQTTLISLYERIPCTFSIQNTTKPKQFDDSWHTNKNGSLTEESDIQNPKLSSLSQRFSSRFSSEIKDKSSVFKLLSPRTNKIVSKRPFSAVNGENQTEKKRRLFIFDIIYTLE